MEASSHTPVVPGIVPVVLLLVLEAAAILASVLLPVPGLSKGPAAIRTCARCLRLHAVSDGIGRVADGMAAGAAAFLIALPFVAASFERPLTFVDIVLAATAVAAVLALLGEADFLVRSALARLWPRQRWNAAPARLVGGGARWCGALFAGYLFQPREGGIASLFNAVGARLAADLASPATIFAAGAILAASCFIGVAARWIVPFVLGSLPTTLAARRDPHGSAA